MAKGYLSANEASGQHDTDCAMDDSTGLSPGTGLVWGEVEASATVFWKLERDQRLEKLGAHV